MFDKIHTNIYVYVFIICNSGNKMIHRQRYKICEIVGWKFFYWLIKKKEGRGET